MSRIADKLPNPWVRGAAGGVERDGISSSDVDGSRVLSLSASLSPGASRSISVPSEIDGQGVINSEAV
jgi:hypothetical protein